MSCDPKYRNNEKYVFFLLLVKELKMIKQCKSTYLRQATHLPGLSKKDILNATYENLSRANRTFEVFKTMRGTSMYYEESKKNLFAMLRQLGCPNLFFTMSMAEFKWDELLKEILETVYRRKFSDEEVAALNQTERNRLIAENYLQTTLHFQKRTEKIFNLMKNKNFFTSSPNHQYHVENYYFRIEFQARGQYFIHILYYIGDIFHYPNLRYKFLEIKTRGFRSRNQRKKKSNSAEL